MSDVFEFTSLASDLDLRARFPRAFETIRLIEAEQAFQRELEQADAEIVFESVFESEAV